MKALYTGHYENMDLLLEHGTNPDRMSLSYSISEVELKFTETIQGYINKIEKVAHIHKPNHLESTNNKWLTRER